MRLTPSLTGRDTASVVTTMLPALVLAAMTSLPAKAEPLVYRTTTAGTSDTTGIWSPTEMKTDNGKPAKVFTYTLVRGSRTYTVSQVWNDACAQRTCPTRVVLTDADGSRRVLLTEDMQQIIPPNDPKFAGPKSRFAQVPFDLSADGQTLTAGPDTFELPK